MSTQKTKNDSTLLSDVEKKYRAELRTFEQGLDILTIKQSITTRYFKSIVIITGHLSVVILKYDDLV